MGVAKHSWFYLYTGLKKHRYPSEGISNQGSDLITLHIHYLPLSNLQTNISIDGKISQSTLNGWATK